ncbi:kinase-like domain-containing protein [Mucor lusitanicus]|uniref:Kinase-like domain-containing protein n=2 Tax=Mucor circinelloides f. lusitanicus TaxID=29924 RepID=A0A8H4EYT7_MUCCL|nr:kinase-like domain-containing protein [Mucor lusitanicus]
MNKRKELYSFVPQEITRHFIESNPRPTSNDARITSARSTAIPATILLNQDAESSSSSSTSSSPSTTDHGVQDELEQDQATLYEYEYEYEDEDDSTLCDSSSMQDSDSSSSSIMEQHDDSDVEVSQPQKLSFMRGLFSKLRLHSDSNQPQQHQEFGDASPYLSTYGTLVNKRIGEGVSATVQLSHRQQDDAVFAVKIFRKRKRRETLTGYMKALAGEFCIASALNHPNIIKTLDFVRMDHDHERYCIVMEFCPEGDMYALIKQGKLQDDEIYAYFKQLLLGLNYLHSLGVAHRDLKPENLLVHKGVLKISDFGSADVFRVAWQEHSRLSDGLCGTTPYMAPEIFLDQGYWAAPVDVWAAGIILFCMKFDGVPFGSALLTDTNYPIYLRKRPLRQYDPFNKLAREPRTLMYAMLNPDCNRRIAVQDVLNMPWMQTIVLPLL